VPFQIVEFALDTRDNVIERKVIAPSFKTRDEAITHVKNIISKFEKSGYQPKHDSWWARAADGETFSKVLASRLAKGVDQILGTDSETRRRVTISHLHAYAQV